VIINQIKIKLGNHIIDRKYGYGLLSLIMHDDHTLDHSKFSLAENHKIFESSFSIPIWFSNLNEFPLSMSNIKKHRLDIHVELKDLCECFISTDPDLTCEKLGLEIMDISLLVDYGCRYS
jgi:hypothetical protein